MTLISALLGIAADRLLPHLHEYRQYDRFLQYVDWMQARFAGSFRDGTGRLLLILLPLWLAVGLLQVWVGDWLFGLAGLLFNTAILIYCLGPRDLATDVNTYCEVADSSDENLRRRAAGRLLNDADVLPDQAGCTRCIIEVVMVEAASRLFTVLLWFIVLGPLGAVMVRSTAVLYAQRRDQRLSGDSVAWLYALLLWVPARLLALSFALSGHFDAALEGWRQAHREAPRGVEGSERVLKLTGVGALGLDDLESGSSTSVRAALHLVWRTLALWLVVLSLLVLVD